jgi:polysaccharide pyruvyl transferase WcaK-like protein
VSTTTTTSASLTKRESLFGRFVDKLKDAAKDGIDADRVLMGSMAAFIELAKSRYALDKGAEWEPGRPLKLLLAGYTGTRNTGGDVRVEEMIRQFRHIFGDEHIELSILTIDPTLSQGYFRTVRQLTLPQIFPKFLFDTVHQQHGVVTCEGSMFKSKFANALSTMMVGALGLASAEGKIAVGYGGEAGNMDPSLEDLVRKYCQDALIIARNAESREVLGRLGVESRAGTDTAWTFRPAHPDVGRKLLMDAGWDGVKPVIALCPINAFWWPVKPDVLKGALVAAGAKDKSHYKSVYFHADSKEIRAKQKAYVDAIAVATARFRESHDCFPIAVGMEQLDRGAGEMLSELYGRYTGPGGPDSMPVFVSDEHEMYEMVSVIRQASAMVSSRYHAMVTSMPGLVPSAGITMDERIRNLMIDRGTPHLALEVDDPDLADKTYDVLVELHREGESMKEGIGRTVVKNLERMGQMGIDLTLHVKKHHPEFPLREGIGEGGDPWNHLPSLPPNVARLRERYG